MTADMSQHALMLSKAAMQTADMQQMQARKHDMLQLQSDIVQLQGEEIMMMMWSALPVSPTWRGQRRLRPMHKMINDSLLSTKQYTYQSFSFQMSSTDRLHSFDLTGGLNPSKGRTFIGALKL